MNWIIPKDDKRTVLYCEDEWRKKGDTIVSLCKNKKIVVQAGGNIGIFPYYLSNYFDKVFTFEPVNKNYKCLLQNIKTKSNIEAFNYGLGEVEGKVSIEKESIGNCGAIRLKPNNRGNMLIKPLDAFPLNNLDLLWLDIEGYEIKALKGAIKHISYFKPIIVLENNGLIHEFPGDLNGSKELRTWIKDNLNYTLHSRMMRDDIYIPL